MTNFKMESNHRAVKNKPFERLTQIITESIQHHHLFSLVSFARPFCSGEDLCFFLVDLRAVEIGRTPAMVFVIHGNKNRSETMAGVLPIFNSSKVYENNHKSSLEQNEQAKETNAIYCLKV